MKSIFITIALATFGAVPVPTDQYGDLNPGRGCHVCGIVISDPSTSQSDDANKYVKAEDSVGSQASVPATETKQALIETSTGTAIDAAAESDGVPPSNYDASAGVAASPGAGEGQASNNGSQQEKQY
ncbi:hypothetical protein DSO57_1035480 [Entomophthora muscae]|uniref:Uncharacterized protein n=1 Tax=Entomophthora muscae TaxID=34485 RepID=A0ACC2S1P0_9FUNG|nr:hypothetical protein DSO57_1035480 [Entomophthora muscae]